MEVIKIVLSTGFLAATVRMATPLIFGTIGELIGQLSGVMNLGIEGIMTMGAMVAWFVATTVTIFGQPFFALPRSAV